MNSILFVEVMRSEEFNLLTLFDLPLILLFLESLLLEIVVLLVIIEVSWKSLFSDLSFFTGTFFLC